jgi:DNA-directed RNA polymerase subunit RPC12/RpoP
MEINAFSLIAVAAATHPPGYSLHKYWARKPHNVVRAALVACGVRSGDLVIDPFCGSGVPLSEAASLGATCIGFDINPVAVELTKATLSPPDADAFLATFSRLLDDAERQFAHLYQVNGRQLRYAVHAIEVECTGCQRKIAANEAIKAGKRYQCPSCSTRLALNLEKLVGTRILRVAFHGRDVDAVDPAHPAQESVSPGSQSSPFDQCFVHNARILAYQGMRTRDLFTARNFAVLSYLASRVAELPEDLRPACELTLTAAIAQCSRLIAYRNGLSTGGPAWTVPGFWVPPLHLENNPLYHLRTRAKKSHRAFAYLRGLAGRTSAHTIRLGDAAALLATTAFERRPRVAFLDPPYGDSVPYLEFSALWNSFLGPLPDPAGDIAVSNRSRGDGTWNTYEAGLARTIRALRDVIADGGQIVVTFNNKDMRAWQALLGALQNEGFRCGGAFYQHPAVVSTKAQLAQEGSYVGDFYCVFSRSGDPADATTAEIESVLANVLSAHHGAHVDTATLTRVALTEFLRSNVKAELVTSIDAVIARARDSYANREGEEARRDTRQFASVVLSVVKELTAAGTPVTMTALAAELHKSYAGLGVVPTARLRQILDGHFEVADGKIRQLMIDVEAVPAQSDARRADDQISRVDY